MGSRVPSRSSSVVKMDRSGLAMTVNMKTASFVTAPEPLTDHVAEESVDDVEPQWADARTQAEAAALQAEMEEDDDPYGVLDFSGQDESSDDEEEVKKAMARYGMRGLGWMDDAIDALLNLEQEHDLHKEETESASTARRASVFVDDLEIEEPPSTPKTYWETAYWFGRVIRRAAAG